MKVLGIKEQQVRKLLESESNQGPCNQESGKKDDTLTTETTSDTEGGFIVEVNVPPPQNRLHRIRIGASIFCSFFTF